VGMGGGWIMLGNTDYVRFIRFPVGFGLCLVITVITTMHNLSYK